LPLVLCSSALHKTCRISASHAGYWSKIWVPEQHLLSYPAQ